MCEQKAALVRNPEPSKEVWYSKHHPWLSFVPVHSTMTARDEKKKVQ